MPEAQESPRSRIEPGAALDPRWVVCDRLAEQAGRLGRLDISGLDTGGIDGRDAALAHAIYDAAIRRWLTIGQVVGSGLSRPFQQCHADVQAALACAAAQMLFLDRVPDHAAVSLSVEWASRRGGRKVGGFVNAGLRRLAELRGEVRERWTDGDDQIPLADGRGLGLRKPVLAEMDVATRLSFATSHSRSFVRRWVRTFGEDDARRICLHSIRSAPTIVNAVHAREPLETDGLDLAAHERPGHFIFGGDRSELVALLESRSDVWVQDPASSASLELASGLTPSVIVDVCAGKGTKTRQIAAMFPSAQIVATDADEGQRRVLAGVFAGHERVEVEAFEGVHERWAGRADLVLLDVPCSNSGVLARRMEARYRGSSEAMERIRRTQVGILGGGASLLSPGGRLVYATCSLEESENHGVAKRVGGGELGLEVERDRLILPAGGPGVEDRVWHDGSYACLLARPE